MNHSSPFGKEDGFGVQPGKDIGVGVRPGVSGRRVVWTTRARQNSFFPYSANRLILRSFEFQYSLIAKKRHKVG